jgi:hypothetical protein
MSSLAVPIERPRSMRPNSASLKAKVHALSPPIKTAALAAEQAATVPAESIEMLRAAGFFDIVSRKRSAATSMTSTCSSISPSSLPRRAPRPPGSQGCSPHINGCSRAFRKKRSMTCGIAIRTRCCADPMRRSPKRPRYRTAIACRDDGALPAAATIRAGPFAPRCCRRAARGPRQRRLFSSFPPTIIRSTTPGR